MRSIARLAVRAPVAVLLTWIAAVIGLQAINVVTGPDMRDVFSLEGADSQAAYDLLGESFPELAGDVDLIAWRVSEGDVRDPAARDAAQGWLADIAEVDAVAAVVSPFEPQGAHQISADGTIAYAQVAYVDTAYNLELDGLEAVGAVVDEAHGSEVDGTAVTVGHVGQGASRLSDPEVGVGELLGIAIAAVILYFAFGTVRAATVPLISAVVALVGSLAALGLFSQLTPIALTAPLLSVLLGMGIGIDYALFIVNRHRTALRGGMEVRRSIVASITTSGRAVVFAGMTVFISLTGMLVPQVQFLSSLAIAAAITVVFSVAASVTLVPAMLTLLGMRVLSKRERAVLAASADASESAALSQEKAWSQEAQSGRFASLVERRPLWASVAALALLAVLAIPTLSMRLGSTDAGNDPAGTPTRVGYDLVADGFGEGSNAAMVVTVDLAPAAPVTQDALPPALIELTAALMDDGSVAATVGPLVNATGDTAVIHVIPVAGSQELDTEQLLERIRGDYAANAEAAGFPTHVGGAVATWADFTDRIADSLPVFFALVVGLSMLVLLVAFRSLMLPLIGAAMNMLSAAAAFGVVVAVFQWGWGRELIGTGDGAPIEPFVPLILFALLFGLSMDYQVFLVSRMAELWHSTGDNALAVRRGLAEVSRVIIAAASIMVVVFGSFVTSDARVMKLLGLGLAVAILIDAFVIRVFLMPAIMRLLGSRTWWIPAWLDRVLPHIDIDGATQSAGVHGESAVEDPAPAMVGAARR
jgi:RND superfamily putative drug exporter